MKELCLPSPAKINLFLHVVGRRPDGYHLLQTAFQFLNLCDEMQFALRSDGDIHLRTNNVNIPKENNLAFKAAALLQKHTQCRWGVDIVLNKKIPLGSGLGGGSSNAATTLLALNHLWNTNVDAVQLAALALTLGADVPIFIYGKAAFAEGIGEIFTPLELVEDWLLLLQPNCRVDTYKIFSDSQLTRNTRKITIEQFLENGGHNDCEPIATKQFPEIADALNRLNQHARARMSGTGSSVFAYFKNKEDADEVARNIPAIVNKIITKGLNVSPLYSAFKNLGVSPSGKAQGFDPCIPRFES